MTAMETHSSSPFRLLLASDLHGSNAAFRKLVALAVQLQTATIVFAGDWSGKQPIVVRRRSDGGADCEAADGAKILLPSRRLDEALQEWRDAGIYPLLVNPNDAPGPDELASLYRETRETRLRQWLDYGQTKTRTMNAELIAIPGNDDGPEIDSMLLSHPWVCDIDQRVVAHDEYEFLGLGFSTPTPWHTPRELSEEAIWHRLELLASQVKDWSRVIAVIHIPPFNSGIDLAPEVQYSGDDLPRQTGRANLPVGSQAVRKFIETHHPLAVLSGHCHESRGVTRIGRTFCVNAGSQYHHGNLSACLLSLRKTEISGHQFFLH